MGTAIKHPVPDRISDAQLSASECPDVKKCKWWLNPVWHRMRFTAVPMWQQWTSKGEVPGNEMFVLHSNSV